MEAATTVHRLMRAVRFNCHEVLEGYREVQLDFTPKWKYTICCLRDVIEKWKK